MQELLALLFDLSIFSCFYKAKKPVIELTEDDNLVEYKSVINLTERDAKERIRQNILIVKNIKYEFDSSEISHHYVMRVELEGKQLNGGEKISKYSEITLVLNLIETGSE